MDHDPANRKLSRHSPILWVTFLALVALIFATPACGRCSPWKGDRPVELWKPDKATLYTAETAPVEVYVPLDEAGNVITGDGPYAYYATARLVYVLRFYDVGSMMEGYGEATISRVYTPIGIGELHPDLEDSLSSAEQSAILARTAFPTTEEPLRELSFTGGPEGTFYGTNETTSKQIRGHLEWKDKKYQIGTVRVIFTEGIQQEYIVLGEEVFYNWP